HKRMSTLLFSYLLTTTATLEIRQGDLTLEPVDAIVNAANAHLAHGGGIAGAIVRRGGEVIQQESNAWVAKHGLVTHDRPAYTQSGELACRYIIHAVGPIWGEGDEDRKLLAAVRGSLVCADELRIQSIALPAISTGIFRFPKKRAAGVILDAIHTFFHTHPQTTLDLVRIVLLDDETKKVFLSVIQDQFKR
ncbi:MAG TPA: macro domain-containing protein, partial [Longilinea sp.]|nr:macro domain-containing protein [Longilinea sp.]